ncbi:MAG: 3-hydroxyacyl-CoA dehydrogenase [Lachnospiraceae bacterium]|jgi:3-hydroxyacyl-CoA dehydrogenase
MKMQKVTIAGAGVLGSQIGFQSAVKGKDVTFWLRSEGSIDRAKERIDRWRNEYLKDLDYVKTQIGQNNPVYPAGLIDDFASLTPEKVDKIKQDVENAYNSLKYETDMAKAVAGADFVIEAVAELKDEKHAFFQELAKHLKGDTIVASNSSTLLPSYFAEDTGRPEKYLHFHFANEIWRLNIGEIMVHKSTDPKAKEAVVQFAKEIGMVPVVVKKEQPGYILNSLLVPLLNAANYLLVHDIASVEDIDSTWRISTGAPKGPFEFLDIIGLVTPYNLELMKPGADDPETTSGKIVKLYKEKIDRGELGIAAGKGFYTYDKNGNKI